MRCLGNLRISARGLHAAQSLQLRLRGEDRFALLIDPLSTTFLLHLSAQGYISIVPTLSRNEGNRMRAEIGITSGCPFL
jgi:hypothetical protein